MFKKVFVIFFLLFSTFLFSASEFDKDIVVKNQSRNDKVKTVFREMMDAYEEEDIGQFFSYVSEDRFQQDYMTFYDAIDEDIRIYDILNIDTWVNKITDDGVKRFLEVQWEKRYESSKLVYLNESDFTSSSEYEIIQRGTTEFLFDEINGKYKLIKLSGNNFWGGSLEEWTEEVGDIAGQSSKESFGYCNSDECKEVNQDDGGGTPAIYDFEVQINNCSLNTSDIQVDFTILDSAGATYTPSVEYKIVTGGGDTFTGSEPVGTVNNSYSTMTPSCAITITVDPNNIVTEIDETNNEDSL